MKTMGLLPWSAERHDARTLPCTPVDPVPRDSLALVASGPATEWPPAFPPAALLAFFLVLSTLFERSTHWLVHFLKRRKRNGLAQAVSNLVNELTLVRLCGTALHANLCACRRRKIYEELHCGRVHDRVHAWAGSAAFHPAALVCASCAALHSSAPWPAAIPAAGGIRQHVADCVPRTHFQHLR